MIPGFFSQQAAMNAAAGPPTGDGISFANVRLLMHFDDVNGAPGAIDSSSYGRTMTRQGSAVIDTSQSVFGGSSGYIPASTNGWTTPATSDLDMRGGAFQADWCFRPAANIASDTDSELHTIMAMVDGGAWNYEWAIICTRTYLRFYSGLRGVNNKSLRFFYPPGFDFATLGGAWARLSMARDTAGRWGAWVEGHRCPDFQQGIRGSGESYNARVDGAILTDAEDFGDSLGRTLNIGRFWTFAGLSREKNLDELRYVTGECRDVTSDYTPLATPFPDS